MIVESIQLGNKILGDISNCEGIAQGPQEGAVEMILHMPYDLQAHRIRKMRQPHHGVEGFCSPHKPYATKP